MNSAPHLTGLGPQCLAAIRDHVDLNWTNTIVPVLQNYVRIPNESRQFNPNWDTDGQNQKVIDLMSAWIRSQNLKGSLLNVHKIEGHAPVILLEISGSRESGETVLLYGHADKQPGMSDKWRPGLGPWTPVIEGDRLYGRGSADDGYAVFSSVAAVKALQDHGIPHPRIVVLIEFEEESGSPGLEKYVDRLAEKIGRPELVICLDSGGNDYERLWLTTSLRGFVFGYLEVETMRNAIHSGTGGGVVPSPLDVVHSLITRFKDPRTFLVHPPELRVEIPVKRREEAAATAALLGRDGVFSHYSFAEGVQPLVTDPAEALLSTTWGSDFQINALEGLPHELRSASNAIHPDAKVKFAVRIPPTLSDTEARLFIEKELTRDPPFNARVTLSGVVSHPGWHSPILSPSLSALLDGAATAFFGQPSFAMGAGGSIPFMGLLGRCFPNAQFIITGVLGPESNAHGPNEFLHIPYATRLTQTVAAVLAGFTRQ